MPIRIVAISDTHNYHKSVKLPKGDVLLHVGDMTTMGYEHEVRPYGEWLRSLDFVYKITIAGNHDRSFQDQQEDALEWLYGEENYDHRHGVYYLQDSSTDVTVNGQTIKVYGSPWQPFFCNWAFNLYPEEIKQKWDMIPADTDVLITHGPPYKLNDMTSRDKSHVGCRELRQAIQRVKPKMHVCGHIHEGYGVSRFGDTLIANAASCNARYNPIQAPLVFDYEDGVMTQVLDETKT